MNRANRRSIIDLKLKVLGKRAQNKRSNFCSSTQKYQINSMNSISNKTNLLELQSDKKTLYHTASQKIVQNKEFMDMNLQNPDVSRFVFQKITLMQKHLINFNSFIALLAVLYCLQTTKDDTPSKLKIEKTLLILLTLSHIVLVVFIILRKLLIIELHISSRKIHFTKITTKKFFSTKVLALFYYKQLLFQLIFQALICFIHPLVFLQNTTITTYSTGYSNYISWKINDVLAMLMGAKIIIIIRALLNLSMLSSPRAGRICYYNKVQHDYIFIIKSLYQTNGFFLNMIIFFLTIFLFGFAFQLTQGTVSNINNLPQNGFQKFQNCLWYAIITITTIGYGQYQTKSALARLLASILSCIGVFCTSLIAVFIVKFLTMTSYQMRSLSFLKRLSNRQLLSQFAKKSMQYSIVAINYFIKKDHIKKVSNYSPTKILNTDEDLDLKVIQLNLQQKKQIQIMYKQLKKNLQKTKLQQMYTKNIVLQEDIGESMLYSFFGIKQQFTQILQGQRLFKKILDKTQRQHNIRDKFAQMFKQQLKNLMARHSKKKSTMIAINRPGIYQFKFDQCQ